MEMDEKMVAKLEGRMELDEAMLATTEVVRLRKAGHSIVMTIPASCAREAGLRAGMDVVIETVAGSKVPVLVVRPYEAINAHMRIALKPGPVIEREQ